MEYDTMIRVILSAELLGHLRGRQGVLEVPFEWLVAGIVCDTIETTAEKSPASPGRRPGVVKQHSALIVRRIQY